MKYIKIQNNGILDENLIFLMGASTKSNDHSKIGQFGTGLKYSITWLIRNNIDFKLFLGQREVKVDTVEIRIGENTFNVVRIDGRESSVTTKMGTGWKAWMILREIWCNAIDEGGELREVTESICGEDNKTTFFIQLTGEINEAVQNWNKYFNSRKPVFSNANYKVYPSEGNVMKIYRKGILIKEYLDTASVFDYDFSDGQINELREYTGYLDFDVCYALSEIDKTAITYLIENLSGDKREAKIDMSYSNFSNWKEALGNAKIISYEAFEVMSKMKPESVAESCFVKLPSNFYKRLCKDIEGVSALMQSHDAHTFFEVHDSKLQQNVREAIVILESCNYFIDAELKIIVGVFNDKQVMGRINIVEKTIMLSTSLRDLGLKELIYVLIEETEHFRTSMEDNTREFQNHFIKLYANTLMQANEIKL